MTTIAVAIAALVTGASLGIAALAIVTISGRKGE
jgi:hypothetical protein